MFVAVNDLDPCLALKHNVVKLRAYFAPPIDLRVLAAYTESEVLRNFEQFRVSQRLQFVIERFVRLNKVKHLLNFVRGPISGTFKQNANQFLAFRRVG